MSGTWESALALVADRFRGMTDKEGKPYILHLLRVAMSLDDEEARIAGLLHDIVEDTATTLDELRELGFSPAVLAAVDCLTHISSISYGDYVIRLSQNSIAKQCKLADLYDNYRLDRVAFREGHLREDTLRIQRYILSYRFLRGWLDEGTYRRLIREVES